MGNCQLNDAILNVYPRSDAEKSLMKEPYLVKPCPDM